jgi:tRNA threonylcarbamoyladenosine biosynthesis protein TsaE
LKWSSGKVFLILLPIFCYGIKKPHKMEFDPTTYYEWQGVTLATMPAVAKQIAAVCTPGLCLGLSGTLGTGKTTLIQHLCTHLGVTDTVHSPSFTYMHTYGGAEHHGQSMPVVHVDLYRANLTTLHQLTPELLDIAQQAHALMLIEWPECWPPENLPGGMPFWQGCFMLTLCNQQHTESRHIDYSPVD